MNSRYKKSFINNLIHKNSIKNNTDCKYNIISTNIKNNTNIDIKISILIPIYNGIEYIEDSINSVLNQTEKCWELIIGINGHPENSEVYKTAKEYEKINEKIKVLDLFKIKGKSNTLNKMLEFSNYNYIAILDVDDIWEIDKLENQIKYLKTNYDVVGSKCQYFQDSDIIPPVGIGDVTNLDFYYGNPIINSSAIIKKELCFWDQTHEGLEDYDLWIRLKKQGKKFYNCDKILVKHRIHIKSAFNTNNHINVKKLIQFHSKST